MSTNTHGSLPKSSSSEVKQVSRSTNCCSSELNHSDSNRLPVCVCACVARPSPSQCRNARKLLRTAHRWTWCCVCRAWTMVSPMTRRVRRPTVSLYASLLRYYRKIKYWRSVSRSHFDMSSSNRHAWHSASEVVPESEIRAELSTCARIWTTSTARIRSTSFSKGINARSAACSAAWYPSSSASVL